MIELCYEYLLSCVFVYELSSCGLESSCSHLRNICLTKLLPTMTSTSITLCIWELMSLRMTWPYHQRQLWIILSPIFKARPTLSWRTSVDALSISLTLHIILSCNVPPPRSLASSKTGSSQVLQQYNKTRLPQPFPCCFKDKLYFPTNTPLNSLNFFHALPILALTASDARP